MLGYIRRIIYEELCDRRSAKLIQQLKEKFTNPITAVCGRECIDLLKSDNPYYIKLKESVEALEEETTFSRFQKYYRRAALCDLVKRRLGHRYNLGVS